MYFSRVELSQSLQQCLLKVERNKDSTVQLSVISELTGRVSFRVICIVLKKKSIIFWSTMQS